jgi:hypothetical protein
VTLVLDSGALVALERNERAMGVRLKGAQSGFSPHPASPTSSTPASRCSEPTAATLGRHVELIHP